MGLLRAVRVPVIVTGTGIVTLTVAMAVAVESVCLLHAFFVLLRAFGRMAL